MGIFKNIVKKVALAAVVVAGKRILSKVITDVIDGDKNTKEPVAPTQASKPKSTTSSRRKPATRAKPASTKTGEPKSRTTVRPKAAKAETDTKPAAKPRARKPRTNVSTRTKPAETAKTETASQPSEVVASSKPAE